jgi:hypothetical protein
MVSLRGMISDLECSKTKTRRKLMSLKTLVILIQMKSSNLIVSSRLDPGHLKEPTKVTMKQIRKMLKKLTITKRTSSIRRITTCTEE